MDFSLSLSRLTFFPDVFVRGRMKKLSKEEISALERVVQAMGDAGAQLLEHLHLVSKHLEFWKAREQVCFLSAFF